MSHRVHPGAIEIHDTTVTQNIMSSIALQIQLNCLLFPHKINASIHTCTCTYTCTYMHVVWCAQLYNTFVYQSELRELCSVPCQPPQRWCQPGGSAQALGTHSTSAEHQWGPCKKPRNIVIWCYYWHQKQNTNTYTMSCIHLPWSQFTVKTKRGKTKLVLE
jgi:hypothetical protein